MLGLPSHDTAAATDSKIQASSDLMSAGGKRMIDTQGNG